MPEMTAECGAATTPMGRNLWWRLGWTAYPAGCRSVPASCARAEGTGQCRAAAREHTDLSPAADSGSCWHKASGEWRRRAARLPAWRLKWVGGGRSAEWGIGVLAARVTPLATSYIYVG